MPQQKPALQMQKSFLGRVADFFCDLMRGLGAVIRRFCLRRDQDNVSAVEIIDEDRKSSASNPTVLEDHEQNGTCKNFLYKTLCFSGTYSKSPSVKNNNMEADIKSSSSGYRPGVTL